MHSMNSGFQCIIYALPITLPGKFGAVSIAWRVQLSMEAALQKKKVQTVVSNDPISVAVDRMVSASMYADDGV